jgi:peptidoglycan/LPS O-acetylase OafA/YrhL
VARPIHPVLQSDWQQRFHSAIELQMARANRTIGRSESGGRSHIEGLDGLRGVAAFAVLGFHINAVGYHRQLFNHAYLAVDFFFLLSGFVIGMAYEPRMSNGMSFKTYMRIRLIRLYPMIFLGIALGLALELISNPSIVIIISAFAQFAFIMTSPGPEGYSLNGPQWSLFFELLANAIHAAIFRFLSVSRLIIISVLSAPVLLMSDLYYHGLVGGFNFNNFLGGFPRVIFSFFSGVLIYRLWKSGYLPKVEMSYLLIALILSVVLVLPRLPTIPDTAFVVVIFPAILIAALASNVPPWLKSKAAWAGAISYPLYALHMPLLHAAVSLVGTGRFGPQERAAFWIFVASGIVVISWVATRFWDAPARNWLQAKVPEKQMVSRSTI